jgi:hypothetical protein
MWAVLFCLLLQQKMPRAGLAQPQDKYVHEK